MPGSTMNFNGLLFDRNMNRLAPVLAIGFMMAVGELQRQRMLTGGELELGLGLALAEMNVRCILGNHIAPFDAGAVHNNVKMACSIHYFSGLVYLHAFYFHSNLECLADGGAILRCCKRYTLFVVGMGTCRSGDGKKSRKYYDLNPFHVFTSVSFVPDIMCDVLASERCTLVLPLKIINRRENAGT